MFRYFDGQSLLSEKRNRTYAKGGMLLQLVQYLGSKLNYIELYALETVISLYYKFGWRFIDPSNCGGRDGAAELGKYKDAVKQLYKLFKTTCQNPKDEALTKALWPFRGWASKRANLIRTGQFTGAEATEIAGANGYRMILCKNDNN